MRTLLIHLSDIHFSSEGTAENQGKVLRAFMDDIQAHISQYKCDNNFVIITGDIANKGQDKSDYISFEKEFITPLIQKIDIPRNHFIVVPGNHDVQRNIVESTFDSHHTFVQQKHNESDFNDYIENEDSRELILGKFTNFKSFIYQSFPDLPIGDGISYEYEINDNWSALCLNSALCSEGGFNDWDDRGHLAVSTRRIESWLETNKYKKKMLIMHHPIDCLQTWERTIFNEYVQNHQLDLILSGHAHEQSVYFSRPQDGSVLVSSPQLFSHKYDQTLGYSFIILDESEIVKISYRQYVKERNKFSYGISFSSDDENPGEIILNKNTLNQNKNDFEVLYEKKLRNEMRVYPNQPILWLDRYVTKDCLEKNQKTFTNIDLISETDLILKHESTCVVSPADGGLTCFGYHFLISLYQQQKKYGVLVDSNVITFDKFIANLQRSLEETSLNETDLDWIVFDNWSMDNEIREQILLYVQTHIPDAAVMLLSTQHERVTSKSGDYDNLLDNIQMRYLTPMMRNQMRIIVDKYNAIRPMGECDKVLKRLDDDLRDFNMHRSPLNCITLLEVFESTKFDEYPVNRTLVLEKALRKIFDSSEIPNYQSGLPNMTECEYATGYFCASIIQKIEEKSIDIYSAYLFTRGNYIDVVTPIFEKLGTSLDASILFDILVSCGIFIHYENAYTFRFRSWAYYFAAVWMTKDTTFASFILEEKRYLHYPEILEFYTGKTQAQGDAIEVLTRDLRAVVEMVKERFNAKDSFNPFAHLKLKTSSRVKDQIINSIDEQIKHSALPSDVIDKMLDKTYNPGASFDQEIYQNVVEYTVKHMCADIHIASKALRNTVLIEKNKKQELLAVIMDAWSLFSKIISYVAKDFAQQGFINIEGMAFKLVDEYEVYNDQEKILEIIANIPINLLSLFQDDLYSAKLKDVMLESFEEEQDKIKKHLLACLLVSKTPDRWQTPIENYIKKQSPNSFYLTDISRALSQRKQFGSVADSQTNTTINRLLKFAQYTIQIGIRPNSPKDIQNTEHLSMADVPSMDFVNMRNNKKKKRKK